MSNISAMKQIGARNVGYKIGVMEWSNKMDLIAVSNDKGDVIIYRLNWQKIWTHPAPQENIRVRAISWKPDEKIIAIAYSSGDIILLDVENKEDIYTFSLESDIVTMSWTQNTNEINIPQSKENKRNLLNAHTTYLPTLPNLNSLSSIPRKNEYGISKSEPRHILNFLIVCLSTGCVHLSVFGMLACGVINICEYLNIPSSELKIVDAKMSNDFRILTIVINHDSEIKLIVFENDFLWNYAEPLLNLSIKYFHLINTITYINETIQSIIEAWESVLLEMDNKLTKYAESQSEGAVSADFLELLMFGYPSEDLEHFLTRDLTEKGLKKLGNCIELSYSTIQKLVVKHLHTAILHVCYHLNCIKGMSKNFYYYEPILGEMPPELIQSAGAFLIKTFELQQTIDHSTRDYKIFFRWLYVAIIRLMDETVPDDIATVTQQEINYLAEFLNNFEKGSLSDDIVNNHPRFNLEKVGQYLEDKNLTTTSEHHFKTPWGTLLEENECLLECEHFYPHYKHLSLIQQHKLLKKNIFNFFKNPEKIIGSNFKLKKVVKSIELIKESFTYHTTHVNLGKSNSSLYAIIESSLSIILIEIFNNNMIKSLKIQFQQPKFFENKFSNFGTLNYRHIQFYNENTLSILLDSHLNNRKTSCFIQFPLINIRDVFAEFNGNDYDILDICKISRTVNMYDILDPSWIKHIDNLDGHFISVSGNRKVASVLSESLRRIRFYEMEAEEEDDENDISQNNSLDNSKDSTV